MGSRVLPINPVVCISKCWFAFKYSLRDIDIRYQYYVYSKFCLHVEGFVIYDVGLFVPAWIHMCV